MSHDNQRGLSRRNLLIGGGAAVAGIGAASFMMRKKIKNFIDKRTVLDSFAATPPLVPHDEAKEKTTIYVGKEQGPAANVDAALTKLGGIGKVIGPDDIVAIKVSAQWWNQGMTNVAAVRRAIEHVLELPGFKGEVVVFENTHFTVPDKKPDDPARGLTRAWSHPSDRNVDVNGWNKLGDLIPHFAGLNAPVSFYGLVDGGGSDLAGDPWFDPEHKHGTYGGDDRGPIAAGDARDGYHWDFGKVFRLRRSRVAYAQTPLTWPRFTSPRSGLVLDFKDGVMRRENGALKKDGRALKFINMTTANEHGSTGFTGACKSPMGIVDMSAGALGNHPRVAGYQSVHYFGRTGRPNGEADPTWRMAGPLAYWNNNVRRADLYLTVAEYVAITTPGYDGSDDMRHHAACALKANHVVAGTDPVAIDAWCVKNLIAPRAETHKAMLDLTNPDSKVSRFLRYFRQVAGWGTLDEKLVTVA